MIRIDRNRLFMIIVIFIVSGCTAFDAVGAGGITVDPPLDANDARMRWRWIGLRPGAEGSCPEPEPVNGWATSSLFPDTTNRALRRFCLYEHPGPGPEPPPEVPGLLALEPDAMGVGPAGSTLADATWPALEVEFLSRAGDGDLPLTGQPLPRLAVLDTAATNAVDPELHPGTSPHGFALVNAARELLCDELTGTACVADVTTSLALPWTCFDRDVRQSCYDPGKGGLIGTIGELAQAVQQEVARWQNGGGSSLILNLSVAWDRRFGGLGPVQTMPLPARAVFRAVEDAVCRGALVLAAAGNRSGGPQPEVGPLFPAAWEIRSAPSLTLCGQLQTDPDPADFPGGGSPYRPLVYAVSGVEADGVPLVSTRQGGAPRLAAFADHGVVESAIGEPTAVLTGSSVAAAVVSSAAAAVTYYRSDLAPFEVMEEVYAAAEDRGRPADFCSGGGGGALCPPPGYNVRQVSVCSAVVAACDAGLGSCPDPLDLPTCPVPTPLDLSGLFPAEFEDPAQTQQRDWTEISLDWGAEPACGQEAIRYHPDLTPIDPCPHQQYFGPEAEPWVDPQPGSHACPSCTVDFASPGTLYLEIDSDFDGELTDGTLKCGTDTYNLGVGTLVAGDKVRVTDIDCQGAVPILLTFTVDGDQSNVTPILVTD